MKRLFLALLCGVTLFLLACGDGDKLTANPQTPTDVDTAHKQIPTEQEVNDKQTTIASNTKPKDTYLCDYVVIEQLCKDKATVNQCEAVLNISPSITNNGNIYYILQTELVPVLVLFDIDQNASLLCKLDFSNDINKTSIKQVEVGATLETVHNIDPNGFYPFLIAGYYPSPTTSLHYVFGEGVYIFIYDENKMVSSVRFLEE